MTTQLTTQLDMFGESENETYLKKQLLTYIGSKRSLLANIGCAISSVQARVGKEKIATYDAFSGSGAVSRYMKRSSSYIASNDIELYAAMVARCYLTNRSAVDSTELLDAVNTLNFEVENNLTDDGFIRRLYSPKDEKRIEASDRVFYTPDNARRIDTYRIMISKYPSALQPLLLGPLLSAASIHANTAGVFKGFYKDRATKVGKLGGSGSDALERITAPITLSLPVLSNFEAPFDVFQGDANAVSDAVPEVDLAYLDPPYNQHPYGSNYFMLNLIVSYEEPHEVSGVSGIPVDWTRSGYNVRKKSAPLLRNLVEKTRARFILISFNDEGYIDPVEMREMLADQGSFEEFSTQYNTFRGSRNLRGRSLHVTEHLYLLEKD